MNKSIAILLILCGSALASEKPQLTPAQQVEVRKQIESQTAIIDGEIDRFTKELEGTPPDNKGAVRVLKVRIRNLNELKERLKDEPAYWENLRQNKKYDGLHWKEPSGDEKEGRWVRLREVIG